MGDARARCRSRFGLLVCRVVCVLCAHTTRVCSFRGGRLLCAEGGGRRGARRFDGRRAMGDGDGGRRTKTTTTRQQH